MNRRAVGLLTYTRIEADRLLSQMWSALAAPLTGRSVAREDITAYTFRFFDFDLRLTLTALDQEPATVAVRVEIRSANIARKAVAVAVTPFDGGWDSVASTAIHDVAELPAALDTLARAVENRHDVAARQRRQMAHRI